MRTTEHECERDNRQSLSDPGKITGLRRRILLVLQWPDGLGDNWDIRTVPDAQTWDGDGEGWNAMLTEDDDGDVDGAEDAELVGLLEETVLALYICARRTKARVKSVPREWA